MKNLKSIAGAIAFMVLWAGAALAMPTNLFSPDEEPSAVADLVEDSELEAIEVEPTPVTEGDEDSPKEEGDETDETDGEKTDNHGKAVSTAAHCDLKGRSKGQLVNSVARDKSATVESAQAACDAAIAAAATTVSTKPVKAPKVEKTARAPKPEKTAPKPKQTAEAEEVVTDEPAVDDAPASESGPPADAGPPADKGPKKP